jgi:hypothetical protein
MLQKINLNWIITNAINFIPPGILFVYTLKRIYLIAYGAANSNQLDFFYYWVASSLILDGNASILYNFSAFQAILERLSGNPFPIAWFYPPIYMLIVWPLSLMPYHLSLVIWLLAPLIGFTVAVFKIVPNFKTILLCIAFPSTILNLDYGQNGLLSASLLGWGLFLLDRRPITAGVFLGILCYKPQLTVLIPIALLASHKWRSLISTFLSFLFLSIICIILFGYEIWILFFNNLELATKVIEKGSQGFIQNWALMITPFSMARLAHLPLKVAYILQCLTMIFAAATTFLIWFRFKSLPLKNSILVICILLFTPHAFEYDFIILALPLAWIYWEGHTKGWLKGEKEILAILWLSPLFSKYLVKYLNLQIIPFLLGIFLYLAIRRLLFEER